jgi:hypothetical protein
LSRDPLLDVVPEDALREVLEAEERRPKRRRRLPYPRGRDLAEAVVEAARLYAGHPDGFPDFVLEVLEAKGFYTGHVTVKRIWRMYESLVRRGVIGDLLGVVDD